MKTLDPHAELERHCEQFKTYTAAAEALGITGPYLRDMLHGRRDISANMLERLGLKRIVTVVKQTA